MRSRHLLSFFLLFLILQPAETATFFVPDDYATIQDAIDESSDGDTVMVSPGTYSGSGNINISFTGKSLSVISTDGPDGTVIDCNLNGYGFIFESGEDSTALLDGFTLKNGYSDDLGGGIIAIFDSSPTILNCSVTNCEADYGGAVYCAYDASPVFGGCTFSNNTGGMGGGVFCYFSSPIFINCVFTGNNGYQGGGMALQTSFPSILDCTFSGNSALTGGGVKMYWSDPIITGSILWDDEPDELFGYYSSPEITYSDVKGGWEGEGNLAADPLFQGSGGENIHLTSESPCIDAGTDTGTYTDIDGQVRPLAEWFDMGADEYLFGSLVVFTEDYPDSCMTGSSFDFTAGVTNTGSEPGSFDEAMIEASGPASSTIPLYSGSSLTVEPQSSLSTIVSLNVPVSTPPGTYEIKTIIYSDGSEISADSFYIELTD